MPLERVRSWSLEDIVGRELDVMRKFWVVLKKRRPLSKASVLRHRGGSEVVEATMKEGRWTCLLCARRHGACAEPRRSRADPPFTQVRPTAPRALAHAITPDVSRQCCSRRCSARAQAQQHRSLQRFGEMHAHLVSLKVNIQSQMWWPKWRIAHFRTAHSRDSHAYSTGGQCGVKVAGWRWGALVNCRFARHARKLTSIRIASDLSVVNDGGPKI